VAVDPTFLAEISLFSKLDADERCELAAVIDEEAMKSGQRLFRAGDPGDALYIIKRGRVELSVQDKAGQKIVLNVPEMGELFGDLSMLDGTPRSATAVALDDGELYVLDREDLLLLVRKRPEAALDMLSAMGQMTRKANALLQSRVSRNLNEEDDEEKRDNIILRTADWVANFSGSITFLIVHIVIFAAWIIFNVGIVPIGNFDPYPFGLLTMAVSLEAIMLSTLLLFSGNRQAARDRIRSDIEYEVNLKAELEVAHLHDKIDQLSDEIRDRFVRLEKSGGVSNGTRADSTMA